MSEEPKTKHSVGSASFWEELKRRKVVRVAIAYAAASWAMIEVTATVFPQLGLPEWAPTLVTVLLIIGFPIAIILSWAFDLTSKGIVATDSGEAEASTVSGKQRQKKMRIALVAATVVPTFIFGLLALFFYVRSSSDPSSLAPRPSARSVDELDRSIAVLPLENLSPNPDHVFFADGVHEEIITKLAQINDLMVIGRTSMRRYRDTIKPLRQIGEELGVAYLLEGSVQRVENQVAITVQLIDAKTEGHVWAETYNRTLHDVFAIRSDIAKEVAGELKAALTPEEIIVIESRPTDNDEAYDLYVTRGEGRLEDMLGRVQEVVRLDPDFRDAWIYLAINNLIVWRQGHKTDNAMLGRAHYALDQVRRLSPESTQLYGLLSAFSYNEDNDLESALSYSLKSSTGDKLSKDVGLRYLQLGQLEEALYHQQRSIAFDPFNEVSIIRLYINYLNLRMWEEARALLDKNLKDPPENPYRLRVLHQLSAQQDYLRNGDRDDLWNQVSKVPGFLEGADGQLWKALHERDFQTALKHTSEYGGENYAFVTATNFSFLQPTYNLIRSFQVEPISLLSALLWFELGDQEKSLAETAKAKAHWEKILAGWPKQDPDHWAMLALCHALEGDGEAFEATLPKIRELTSNVNWQYRRQALCEMRIAVAYLILGDQDQALSILEAAQDMHTPLFLQRELELWFMFDSLRRNPRFDKLLVE